MDPVGVTSRVRRVLGVVGPAAAAVALLVVLAGSLAGAGVACYVVASASMGTAAPVGALVVTRAVDDGGIDRGDLVAFRPPAEPGTVYIHRVVRIDGDRVVTRGDLNAAADAWTLRRDDVVGRAVAVLPGAGFVVRAAPIVLIGVVVVALATWPVRNRTVRSAARLVGASAVLAAAAMQVKPFVGLTVLAAAPLADGGFAARIVSTGLLPVLVTGADRDVVLGPGATARLLFSDASRSVGLHASLAFTWWQWVSAVLACLLPTACSLLLAARSRRVGDAAA